MSQRLARNAALDAILAKPFMGAEGDGDPENDPANGEGDNGDEGDPNGDGSKPPAGDTISREEFDALFKRMQAADRRASDAEKKAKQYEDKDKSELERTSGRVTELEAENTALKTQLDTLRRENAFYGNNSVTWHNPGLAIKELNWDGVVSEDGEVDGAALKRAIESLSKSMPYLVKAQDDGKGKPPAGPPSGTPAGSGPKGGNKNDDRDKLLKKYPALRR